jgi:hypothetical protein
MKKGVLVYILCLLMLYATAQDEATGFSAANVFTIDTTSIIANLSVSVRENSKVILNWKQPADTSFEFAVVERSQGGQDFEMVAVLKRPDMRAENEWIDDAPAKGRSLYRIRFSGRNGMPLYSKAVPAMIAGDISFRFYPNPVDNILIIRSENILDIQIVDAVGKPRISHNRLQGLETINVSNLEKGIYFLRVNNRSTGMIIQEKLLKN